MTSIFDLKHQNSHLASKIVIGLERLYEAYITLLRDVAKKQNLSPIQVQILIFIDSHTMEYSTVSYLATEFSLTKATLSDSVKTLVNKNLVQKTIHPDDTRSSRLKLTTKGHNVVSDLKNFPDSLLRSVEGLSEKDQIQFWSLLRSLLTSLQKDGVIGLQRMCFCCVHYTTLQNRHYCNHLKTHLADEELRVDCPDHKKKQT